MGKIVGHSQKKQRPKPGRRQKYAEFVRLFLKNGRNATAAALELGYPEESAGVAGYDLLNRPETRELLQAAEAQRLAALDLELDDLVRLAWRDAQASLVPMLRAEDNGTISLDLSKCTPEQLATLEAVTVTEGRDGSRQVRLRLTDRHKARDQLARLLGLYAAERHEIGGPGGVPLEPLRVVVEHTTRANAEAARAVEQAPEGSEDGRGGGRDRGRLRGPERVAAETVYIEDDDGDGGGA